MLKGFLLLLTVFCLFSATAQELVVAKLRSETSRNIKKDTDTANWNWKHGGLFNLNVAQSSLSNWAAGGDNFNLNINSYFNYFAFYKKERQSWDNNLDVNLGFVQSTSQGGRKNDDRFDLLSKYGYKMDSSGKWYLSGLFNFRSQLFDGYSFSGNKASFTSSFFAPAYMIISAGLDYKPDNNFSLFFSPLTSRTTLVLNKKLSNGKGINYDCFNCLANNKQLYYPDIHKDIELSNACLKTNKVTAEEIIINGEKFYYTIDPDSNTIKIFKFNNILNAYQLINDTNISQKIKNYLDSKK